jgi:hypothetical protein
MAVNEGSYKNLLEENIVSHSELLTWGEAVRIYTDAGVSVSTFRRRVDERVIKGIPGQKRRDTRYPRDEVLTALSKERKAVKKALQREAPAGSTDWVRDEDLLPLLKLDRERYGEYTVDISVTQHWWRKNPSMCRILFNRDNREDIWGAITIMPMKGETIFKLLRGNLEERDITPDDLLTFEDGGIYDGYVLSAVISPKHRESFKMLLDSVFDYWCERYPRVQFRRFYTLASSPEGEDMVRKLFFAPRYDLGENAYELDLRRRNPSPLVKKFQRCIGLEI